MRGALFETWVVAELLKMRLNSGSASDLYFWRDSNGVEVDVFVEGAKRMHALEIKAGRTIAQDWFAALDRLARITPVAGAVLYAGETGQARRDNPVFGWRDVGAAAKRLLG